MVGYINKEKNSVKIKALFAVYDVIQKIKSKQMGFK